MADPPAVKKDLLLEQVGGLIGQHNHYSNSSLSDKSTGKMEQKCQVTLTTPHYGYC